MNQHEADQLIAILGQFSPLKFVPALVSGVLRAHEDSLLAQPKYQDPRSLARYRAQVSSQNGEDGIIAEIFKRVGIGRNWNNPADANGGRGLFVEIRGKTQNIFPP